MNSADNSGLMLLRQLVRIKDSDIANYWEMLPEGFDANWFSDFDSKERVWVPSALTVIYQIAQEYYDEYAEAPPTLLIEEKLVSSKFDPAMRDRALSALSAMEEIAQNSAIFNATKDQVFDTYQRGRIVEATTGLLRSAQPGQIKTALSHGLDSLAEIARMTASPRKSSIMGETRAASEMIAEYSEMVYQGQEVVRYLPFPFESWNAAIMGMAAGELGVLVAMYNSGKTALLKKLTLHTAQHVDPNEYIVVMGDLEMTQSQLYQRLVAHISGLPWKLVASAGEADSLLTDSEWETYYYAMERAKEVFPHLLVVTPNDCRNTSTLRREIERFRDGRKVALVTVDYLTLMRPTQNLRAARWDQIEEIVQSLKTHIAQDLECAVWTALHTNREGDTQFAVVDRHADICIKLTPDYACPPREPDINHPDPRRRFYGQMGTVAAEVTRNRSNSAGHVFNLNVDFSTMTILDGGVRLDPVAPPSGKGKK